ncbi:hypothetical protein [Geobacter sp. SVR]|uniref:hypothetical protein n=1 Tax=Geobacter sp. SVR TaxID=2495594 RepID=UPI00143EFD41|nr:hypothetical protein [Geobacter sp. SVR]BCS52831.1 lipoprotein [Geobacter sp. SVR]GCF86698.1 lipoprotein [Geobacter sp. SVR]
MIRISHLFLVTAIVSITAGCAGNHELVKAAGSSIRQDVFQDADQRAETKGYADLRIHSSLKTHTPDGYSAKDIHGTEAYKIIVNIDGQSAELRGDLRREKSGAEALHDPEAGEGIRYHFSKNVRLKPGNHKVIIAIPADGIAREQEITLADGSINNLTLAPVYGAVSGKQRSAVGWVTSYKEGMRNLKMILNGREL